MTILYSSQPDRESNSGTQPLQPQRWGCIQPLFNKGHTVGDHIISLHIAILDYIF